MIERDARSQLALLALAELAAMTLWFSATAVLPSITAAWSLSASAAAWMTAAVQLGFVVGALGSALLNLPDVLPPRRMFWICALAGALANAALVAWVDSAAPAIALRFATGVCLAGVYPPGMKIAASHVTGAGRGLAIGVLVGALTLGSATPHLVAGVLGDETLPWRAVLGTSSALAALGALVVARLVRDGPHAPPVARFDPRLALRVLRERGVRLANLGYFGHMWELYAMWSWFALFLAATGADPRAARLTTFLVIGVAGAAGALAGGWLADRLGRTRVTIAAMAMSGACCLASPLAFVLPAPAVLLFGLVWGASIIADSAQFSAAVTELASPESMGTALTLQTSLGFALTLLPIWGLPLAAEALGWRFAFVLLAPGPILGCAAMARLRALPEATRMAGGRR